MFGVESSSGGSVLLNQKDIDEDVEKLLLKARRASKRMKKGTPDQESAVL